ncbi:MAG: hypothetical protein AAGA90_05425 [Actinomycetota bacterium]
MSVPIVAAGRSPFAVADGALAGWHPVDLAVTVAAAVFADADLAPESIDHLWLGCDEPVGAQGANAARAIGLAAGWPEAVGGTTIDAAPHSGMSALIAACDAIESGRIGSAVVIGLSSASIVQPGASSLARMYGRPWGDGPAGRYAEAGGLVPPIVAADRAAVGLGIDRAAQESWGLRSIGRRTSPPSALVTVGARPGDGVAMQRDTPIGADVVRTIVIDALEPIFEADGTTTAAGFAPPADGVSVLVLGTTATPIGEIDRTAVAGGSPFDLRGPVIAAADDDASPDRIDLACVSASMALVAIDALAADSEVVDANGATIAVGDAAAAEDLRLVVDGIHRAAPGKTGRAVRVAPGAAAGCLWRRL